MDEAAILREMLRVINENGAQSIVHGGIVLTVDTLEALVVASIGRIPRGLRSVRELAEEMAEHGALQIAYDPEFETQVVVLPAPL
jgi:hypothetical protein